jgi:hypothetical protein
VDGGGSWTELSSLPYMAGFGFGRPGVHGIYFADPTNGFAFGPSLASTHDGGRDWSVSSMSNVAEVVGAAGVVYAVVTAPDQPGQPITAIWRSPASKDQWSQLPLPSVGIVQNDLPLLRVDGTRLALMDPGPTAIGSSPFRGRIWTSSDQGESWQAVGVPCQTSDGGASAFSVASGHPASWLVDCVHGEQSTGATIVQHHLYGTADAGAHWVQLADPSSSGDAVLLADNGAGHAFVLLVGGPGPSLIGSFDGGRSWRVLIRDNGDARLFNYNNLTFLSSTVGFAKFGQAVGPIYRTDDGGVTWQALSNLG